jgi:uncharacterized membrane protein
MTSLDFAGPLPTILLGLAGGALVGGRSRHRRRGALATLAGMVLVGMAAHQPVSDAIRREDGRRRAASLRLSLVLPQTVPEVFRFCSDFENYPRFIGALREVHDHGDGRSRWVAHSSAGRPLVWDAITTKYVPNRVLAWQSVSDSPLSTSATMRFRPEREGGTCLEISLAYRVGEVSLADALVSLTLGRRIDELEADLRRLPQHLAMRGRAAGTIESA